MSILLTWMRIRLVSSVCDNELRGQNRQCCTTITFCLMQIAWTSCSSFLFFFRQCFFSVKGLNAWNLFFILSQVPCLFVIQTCTLINVSCTFVGIKTHRPMRTLNFLNPTLKKIESGNWLKEKKTSSCSRHVSFFFQSIAVWV